MSLDLWSREFRESTRGKLAALLRRGPATVEELAEPLGLTHNAVRSHLQILSRDGLVQAAGVRRTEGAGKPANLYELTAAADPAFSTAYVPVLEALLGAVSDLDAKARELVIQAAARNIALAVASELKSSEATVTDLATRVLNHLGGFVEVVPGADGAVLQGKGCPVSLLAERHPEICTLVRSVLSEVTGVHVREECNRGERSQCRFVLLKDKPS